VATSANISGTTSLTDPNDCKRDLNGYDLLLDGGILSNDGESTIVEIDRNKLRIVRSGSISEEELKKLF
jgi:tRNA A37 threonylcarbamoyladenosine synthetase subunit TsaC/SUA5/YrdC